MIEHHLRVFPNVRPVKQKARQQSTEKQSFIVQETRKLEAACVIHEVQYPEGWKIRSLCQTKEERNACDLTNLNKACPQDSFPPPRIDVLCFLDAFSGYHHIKMAVEDVEKISFLTPCGVYFYTCMPFGLHNAGATF